MSPSTLESFTSIHMLDTQGREDAQRQAQVSMLRDEFIKAVLRCDAFAIATFAGTTTDFTQRLPGGGYGKRPQTVGEVVHDAVDNKQFRHRAMQILLNAAAGRGAQRDAQQLLEEMATVWAEEAAV